MFKVKNDVNFISISTSDFEIIKYKIDPLSNLFGITNS